MVRRTGAQAERFFVSYAAADRAWAEWIAWQLEAAGHHAIVQAWDFRPGENFVVNMRQALDSSDRTLAIVSAAYLKSVYGSDEWTAALGDDCPSSGPYGSDRPGPATRTALGEAVARQT
jgi:TIR domain